MSAADALDTLTPDTLTDAVAALTARVDQHLSECRPRAATNRVYNARTAGVAPGGRWLVDLGFCNDDEIANILSRAAIKYMVGRIDLTFMHYIF